jgi:hypothetical protein
MPLTSLGRVSNSSSRAFTNAKGAIANVNYGKIVGSYDNNDISYKIQQQNSVPTVTVNLPVTKNQPCYDIYGGGCAGFTNN